MNGNYSTSYMYGAGKNDMKNTREQLYNTVSVYVAQVS